MIAFWLWCFFGISPWVIAGWLRLPRYLQCFQETGYRYEEYTSILWRNPAERRYFVFFCLLLGVYLICGGWLAVIEIVSISPYLAVGLYSVLFVVALYLAPRKPLIEQSVVLEARALRLAVTAGIVMLVPVFAGLGVILSCNNHSLDPKNSPEAMFIESWFLIGVMLIVSAIIGPIAFVLARYAVTIANTINSILLS